MMHKCIKVKVGGSQKATKIGEFINFAKIGEYAICIIGLQGWTPLTKGIAGLAYSPPQKYTGKGTILFEMPQ